MATPTKPELSWRSRGSQSRGSGSEEGEKNYKAEPTPDHRPAAHIFYVEERNQQGKDQHTFRQNDVVTTPYPVHKTKWLYTNVGNHAHGNNPSAYMINSRLSNASQIPRENIKAMSG